MTNEPTAGEGGTTPLPPMPDCKYQGVLGDEESPLFDTKEAARSWVQAQREAADDWDSDSRVKMIVQ